MNARANAYSSFVELVIDGHIVTASARHMERMVTGAFDLDQYGIVRGVEFEKGSPRLPETELEALRLLKSLALMGQFTLQELQGWHEVHRLSVAVRLVEDAVDVLRRAGKIAA